MTEQPVLRRLVQFRLERTLLSWNKFYAGIHPRARGRIAQEWHDLVRLAVLAQLHERSFRFFEGPVQISISCEFGPGERRYDPDNLVAKLVIDGLKGVLLKDDGPDHVHQVILGPCTRGAAPSTLVRIVEMDPPPAG